jgi:TctA family transporter
LLLGLVLGPAIEENFRRAMVLSRGDVSVFLTSPLSAALLVAAAIAIVLLMLPTIRSRREEALQE